MIDIRKMILTRLILMTMGLSNFRANADILTYKMEEHCDTMIHMIMDSVYQIRLQLDDIYIQSRKPARPATCQTEIEPWYTWPKLMFYFENLDLNCEYGYLQFFQSTTNSTRIKGLEADICGDVKPKGIYLLDRERYLQIRYVARGNQYIEDAFSVIITSYAEEPCPDHSFTCDNARCIDREIRCDGYESCGDGSGCRFDLSSAAMAAIIICSLVGLFVLISTVICIVCCVKKNRKSQERAQTQPGVVYTVSANRSGTLGPPSYDSGQNGQRSAEPPSSVSPRNITAGQSPAYPPNFTIPSYDDGVFRNPPPYEEFQTNQQDISDLTDHERENTDNEVSENNNLTDNYNSEDTSCKHVEEVTVKSESPDGQVREVNSSGIELETDSEDRDRNDEDTYETVCCSVDSVEVHDKVSQYKDGSVGLTTAVENKDFDSEIEVVNSYTNFLYSEECSGKSVDVSEKEARREYTVDKGVSCEDAKEGNMSVMSEASPYENISDSSGEQNSKIQSKEELT